MTVIFVHVYCGGMGTVTRVWGDTMTTTTVWVRVRDGVGGVTSRKRSSGGNLVLMESGSSCRGRLKLPGLLVPHPDHSWGVPISYVVSLRLDSERRI